MPCDVTSTTTAFLPFFTASARSFCKTGAEGVVVCSPGTLMVESTSVSIPARFKIAPSRWAVVVLPSVPVTAIVFSFREG